MAWKVVRPWVHFLQIIGLPIVSTLLWLCIPLDHENPTTRFFVYTVGFDNTYLLWVSIALYEFYLMEHFVLPGVGKLVRFLVIFVFISLQCGYWVCVKYVWDKVHDRYTESYIGGLLPFSIACTYIIYAATRMIRNRGETLDSPLVSELPTPPAWPPSASSSLTRQSTTSTDAPISFPIPSDDEGAAGSATGLRDLEDRPGDVSLTKISPILSLREDQHQRSTELLLESGEHSDGLDVPLVRRQRPEQAGGSATDEEESLDETDEPDVVDNEDEKMKSRHYSLTESGEPAVTLDEEQPFINEMTAPYEHGSIDSSGFARPILIDNSATTPEVMVIETTSVMEPDQIKAAEDKHPMKLALQGSLYLLMMLGIWYLNMYMFKIYEALVPLLQPYTLPLFSIIFQVIAFCIKQFVVMYMSTMPRRRQLRTVARYVLDSLFFLYYRVLFVEVQEIGSYALTIGSSILVELILYPARMTWFYWRTNRFLVGLFRTIICRRKKKLFDYEDEAVKAAVMAKLHKIHNRDLAVDYYFHNMARLYSLICLVTIPQLLRFGYNRDYFIWAGLRPEDFQTIMIFYACQFCIELLVGVLLKFLVFSKVFGVDTNCLGSILCAEPKLRWVMIGMTAHVLHDAFYFTVNKDYLFSKF